MMLLLCMSLRASPAARSQKFNDYVFAEMMDPAIAGTVQVEVLRDDQLELRLFQASRIEGPGLAE